MITDFQAEGYGCLQNVHATGLTKLHAFIGPNDSGKSTLLRGIRSAVECAVRPPGQGIGDPFFAQASQGRPAVLGFSSSGASYRITTSGAPIVDEELRPSVGPSATGRNHESNQGPLHLRAHDPAFAGLVANMQGVRLVRFDPDALRLPSQLLTDGQLVNFADERGRGLAGVYDAIRNRGDDAYERIAAEVRRLFPPVELLQLTNISSTQKKMQVKLRGGTAVPAEQMSEGLLYFLAYAALPYLGPTSLLLVEEPENGLHPSRIHDVVKALRGITETTDTQILMATHSPLVVNELRPDEVSVVTRTPEGGTLVRKLNTATNFEERSKVYALGELWLSYANGLDEAPLFAPAAS